MASYPTTPKSFTSKATNDVVQASHVNDLQDEVTAVETALLGSLDHDVTLAATRRLRLTGTTAVGVAGPAIVPGASGLDIVANTVGIRFIDQAFVVSFGEILNNGTQWLVRTDLFIIVKGEAHQGITTAPQITADQNNYAPTGLLTSRILRLSTDAARNVTGLLAGSTGQRMLIHNGGSFNLVLVHESASSTAANRFTCPGLANLTLNSGDSVEVFYDNVASRWVAIGV